MSWAIGFVNGRDVGYGVPALCDQPGCNEEIDRGLGCICGGDVGGGEKGCGLFFCGNHGGGFLCEVCAFNEDIPEADWRKMKEPFDPKPDIPRWIKHKLTHHSWAEWRQNHPGEVKAMEASLAT